MQQEKTGAGPLKPRCAFRVNLPKFTRSSDTLMIGTSRRPRNIEDLSLRNIRQYPFHGRINASSKVILEQKPTTRIMPWTVSSLTHLRTLLGNDRHRRPTNVSSSNAANLHIPFVAHLDAVLLGLLQDTLETTLRSHQRVMSFFVLLCRIKFGVCRSLVQVKKTLCVRRSCSQWNWFLATYVVELLVASLHLDLFSRYAPAPPGRFAGSCVR